MSSGDDSDADSATALSAPPALFPPSSSATQDDASYSPPAAAATQSAIEGVPSVGSSAVADGGSDSDSGTGEAMGALGDIFDDTNELAADALVFCAAEGDYEQEDWGWGDDSTASVPDAVPDIAQNPGKKNDRYKKCEIICFEASLAFAET